MSRLLFFKSLKFLDLLKSSRYFSVVILLLGLTLLTPKIGFSQTSPTVILSDTDADNVLAASDTVTIKVGFSEAMNATPTISITGVVTNVTMTALAGAEKAIQIGETLYGSATNDMFGAVSFAGYGDTHLSKNGKVFAFTSERNRLIVYELVNSTWTNITGNLPQTLVSGAEQNTMALSRDGHTIVIGAYNNTTLRNGRIYAYRYNGSSWTRLGDDTDMLGYDVTYQLGYHVDISDDGNRIFANGQGKSGYEADGGYINVYDWDGTDWNMHKNSSGNTKWSFRDALSAASDARDFGKGGISVSSDGNRVIVETMTSDIISTWDYTPSGSASWTMTPGYLTPPYTGYLGTGLQVSDDGNTFIIGVKQQSVGSGQTHTAQGNVFVYSWNSGTSTWTLKGSNIPIVGSTLDGGEYLGENVSISSDGNRISFGNVESAADRRGKVAIYDYNASSNQWVEYVTLISDTSSSRNSELSGDGNRILIGDNFLDVDGISNIGSIEVYQLGGYKYVWDVDDPSAPSDGTYKATVAGTASATSIAYSGTQSITFTLDTTAPTVTLTDTDADNFVNVSQVVTITAGFSEAMTATPTISITGIVTNVIMTPVSGTNSYTFTWDTSSGTLSDGTYSAKVSGTDIIGNSYVVGTQSITFTLDTSAPTVNITTSDSDNTIKPGDNITVTATFNEAMATAPRITIGSAVSNVALTATNSTTFTYSWSTSGVSSGSYTVTVTGTNLAGNAYAGSDKITIRLDSTAPSVTLANSDSDNLIAASDTVTITATFSEALTTTPTISISGGLLSNVVMGGGSSGSVTFTAADIATSADYARSVFAADMDGDGDMDILSASTNDDTIAWYENDGNANPTWTADDITTSADGATSVFAADMDGDGDMDIVSTSENDDTIAWYENDGNANPTWTKVDIDTNADGARSVFAADMDGDGDMDILSASIFDNTIAWYENDGNANPTWAAANIDTSARSARSVFAADMDGDGDMDIVSANFNDHTIAWYENDGNANPTWTKAVIGGTADVWSVFAADMDGDGDMDILSASWSPSAITWLENDGNANPSWAAANITTDVNGARSVFAADIDSDGDMDIVSASGYDNTIAWYENDGNANPTWTKADIATDAEFANSVFAADMDGDGDMDILSASLNDDTIAWYENGVGYSYSWDVDGGGTPSNGTYYATVAAADKAGNAYVAGTQSITFTLDTTAPTVTLTNTDNNNKVNTSSVVTFTAVFSEALQGSPTITIPGIVTDTPLTLVSGTTWKYTWDTSSGTLAEGSHTVSITGQDSAGNSATVTSTFVVDTTVPTLSGLTNNDGNNTLNLTDTVTITATFNEPMNNSPTITIGNGVTDVAMTATSSTVWTYFLDMSSWSGSGSSAVVTVTGFDGAENSYAGTDSFTFNIDTTAPTVTAITAISSSGTYVDDDANPSNSDTLNIKVTFSEPVTITGSPTIKLNTNPTRYATYVSGSGTSTPTFAYQVQDGDNVDALGKASDASSITLNGGSISDGANDANLAINSVAFTPSIAVRAKDPTVQYVTIESNNATSGSAAKAGDVITITLAPDAIGGINTSLVTFTLTGFSPQPSLTFTATGTGLYTASFTLDSSATFNQGGVNYSMYLSDTQSSSSITSVNINASAFDNSSLASAFTIDTVTPTITSLSSLNITEGQTTGPAVTTNETTQYSIVGGADQSKVTINPNTGAISFGTAPDYANPDDADSDGVYEVIVQVNDMVGITVTQTIQITTQEIPFGIEFTTVEGSPTEGEQGSYTAVLTSQPTANVTIPISSNNSRGRLPVTQLVFTPDNWNVPQTVTVNTTNNATADGDVTVTITSGKPTSLDANYNNLSAADTSDFTITLVDDEIDTDGDSFYDYDDAFPNDPNENIDTDGDGIGDNTDTDDDGDGQSDIEEIANGTDPLVANPRPGDSDGDGIADVIDPDDDNDGVNDIQDRFPLDANESSDNDNDGIGDNADTDDDNDSYSDVNETAAGSDPLDPSSVPADSDNDKLPDSLEPGLGTDPNNPDTDGDGTIDGEDDFPIDPNYQTDTDGDGIPNKTDPDDDNDGLEDGVDPYPLDPTNQPDTDGDGLNNGIDPDDDNDGFTDLQEEAAGTDPLDPASTPGDRDNDGLTDVEEAIIGTDPTNPDTDGDGVSDKNDAAPLNPNVGLDTDNDGLPDAIDPDDDNDGVRDEKDAFPFDPNESSDYDGDGIGDNADRDDDNDGYDDIVELEDGTNTKDTLDYPRDGDGDGLTNNQELELGTDPANPDTDGDGIGDKFDPEPLDGDLTTDTDGDGIIDLLDPDDDNDGYNDLLELELGTDPTDSGEFPEDQDGDFLPDVKEQELGTDPTNPDTDGDGIQDGADDFPLDSESSVDTDGDGIADENDPDDDNDGVPDTIDSFPLNPSETIDTDGDGIGDNADLDDDNDGYSDITEGVGGSNSKDPNSIPVDTDNDLLSDPGEAIIGTDPNDPDTDDDSFLDGEDPAPFDPLNEVLINDFDGDGIPNDIDPDDDNDGVPDSKDRFPFDSSESNDLDGDGIGDNADPDLDGDGVNDAIDRFPYNPDESSDNDNDGIGDNADLDDDNDGYEDTVEIEEGSDPFNSFSVPEDADRDGLSDAEEIILGTDSNNYDTDGDGVNDKIDAFPLDPEHNSDQDLDGIPDLLDPDDDNDGVLDLFDVFPFDPLETADTDQDGIGNNADPDDDNDGFEDVIELAAGTDPLDEEDFPQDSDGDGLSDVEETVLGTDPNNPDTDGDGVGDLEDPFPLNPEYSKDTDNDGIPDAIDPDDDNDGVPDGEDAFPEDQKEQFDTDGDGIGDNADMDDDNDGYSDRDESLQGSDPKDPNSTPLDSDNDGVSDSLEVLQGTDPNNPDTDGDGVIDGEDEFPLNAEFSSDNDDDGIPDSVDVYGDHDSDGISDVPDIDDDNDGVYDFNEDEFVTIYQPYRFVLTRSSGLKGQVSLSKPTQDKNVGKWKIRKKISGGADRSKFTVKGGEPASNGTSKSMKTWRYKNQNSEGYLAFITPPDPNNPDDANGDGIYEVEVAYINTTYGDTTLPIPDNSGEIIVKENTENVLELNTIETPLSSSNAVLIVSDTDGDGIINSLDPDDDGDHIYSRYENENPDNNGLIENGFDLDGDGFANYLDPDDDNDGIFTEFESPDPDGDFNPIDALDSNSDGLKNYLNPDDDGDLIPTIDEDSDPNGNGNPEDALDFDGDGLPDYLDPDDDGDGIPTISEVKPGPTILIDTDRDGTPDYHDLDDDNDGVPSLLETNITATGFSLDTDGDGVYDHVDTDDDGDGLLTIQEDLNGNGDPTDDDTDFDGIPNYLESRILDSDDDGVVDELDSDNQDPYNDQDGDYFPNMDEKIAGTNPLDPTSYPQNFSNPQLKATIDIVTFFSPNGDGKNDTWQVREIDRYLNNQVWIYTRTGQEIFSAKPYGNNWNGIFEGTDLPEGSYYYRIDLDGNSTIDFEGWLYLTR
jgi:gliding motility-associated-like protein